MPCLPNRVDAQYRQVQVANPEISLLVSVGAITVIYEIIWTSARHFSSGVLTSFGVEIAALSIIWVLWLSESPLIGLPGLLPPKF